MTEQPCRILAYKIYVPMPVQVHKFSTLAGNHGQGKWLIVQNRAGIATGQVAFSALVRSPAKGVGGGVTCAGIFNGLIQRFHLSNPSETFKGHGDTLPDSDAHGTKRELSSTLP